MKRQFLLLALLVGCGQVANPGADGSVPGDGAPPADPLSGTLRTGCIVALHMEEASWSGVAGEVKDDCGGDNPGTARGPGTHTVANGVRGRAASFAGDGCIDIPNASTLHTTTGLTMSAWIFPNVLYNGGDGGANGVISKRVDTNVESEYNLSVWQRNHVWAVVDGDLDADRLEGMATVTTMRWIQLTLVYDGTLSQDQRLHLYINGSLDSTHGETSGAIPSYNSTLHVGCMPAPHEQIDQTFVGQIDEVAIWNRALSQTEITQWYNNTKP
jgi:MSHA biogenesis protein MshQ